MAEPEYPTEQTADETPMATSRLVAPPSDSIRYLRDPGARLGTPTYAVGKPPKSKAWIVLVILAVVVAALLIPVVNQQRELREKARQEKAMIAIAQENLQAGRYEEAAAAAKKILALNPDDPTATSVSKSAKIEIERQRRAGVALAAAEKMVTDDRIVDAIAAFGSIADKLSKHPEDFMMKAEERVTALRKLTATLSLPKDWPRDAIIMMDGKKQKPEKLADGIKPASENSADGKKPASGNPADVKKQSSEDPADGKKPASEDSEDEEKPASEDPADEEKPLPEKPAAAKKPEPGDLAITDIPFGIHTFVLMRDSHQQPPDVKLEFSGIRPVVLPEIQWREMPGKISLSSTPSGAAVWLKGEDTGKVTPCTFDNMEAGKTEFLLKYEGHVDTPLKGELPGGDTLELAATLPPHPRFPSAGNQAGDRVEFNITPEMRVAFRWCPAGTFVMGGSDPAAANDEKPLRKVTLSEGFWLGETEFTRAQWAAIEGETAMKSVLVMNSTGKEKNPGDNPELPMTFLNWELICGDKSRTGGVLGKINEFFRKNGVTSWTADLPSEAQWEYACRAGTNGPKNPFGIKSSDTGLFFNIGWHQLNSKDILHPVGLKDANPWGFKDMHGNARECTRDWYESNYSKLSGTDPAGPTSGWKMAMRGGSFRDPVERCRSAARSQAFAFVSHSTIGFRLLLRPGDNAPVPPVVQPPPMRQPAPTAAPAPKKAPAKPKNAPAKPKKKK